MNSILRKEVGVTGSWLRQRAHQQLCIVLVLACLSFGIGIHWGLPHAVNSATVSPWEMDSVAPIMPLNEAYHRFTRAGNEWVTYPLFHLIVLDVMYAPYLAFEYLRGNLTSPSQTFPYGMREPIRMARDLTLLARLVSLVMALGIVLVVYQLTVELFSAEAAFWAALMTTFLAPLTYYAKASNLDVPYLFWSSLAFWQYVKIIKLQRLRHYWVFAVCASLAVATKDQAYGFFVLIPGAIVYARAHHMAGGVPTIRQLGWALLSKPILLSLIVAVGVFSLANNLLFGGWTGFFRHLAFHRDLYHERMEIFPQLLTLNDILWQIVRSIHTLIQTFGYGSVILAVGGVLYMAFRRHWLSLSILFFPVSYYIFCLSFIGLAPPRYLLGPAILLTPFAGLFIVELLKKQKIGRILAILGVVVSIMWQVALTANLTMTLIKDSRYQAESWIKRHVPVGATIESQVALERYLPHIVGDYNVSLLEPLTLLSSVNALQERDPQYILLGSLGNADDPENWLDLSLIQNRDALLKGELGYRVVAKFDTPHFIPYRQIIGTRPSFILLAKSPETGRYQQTVR